MTEELQAAVFKAQIKQLTIKTLVSCDKEARIILQFTPQDELVDQLNRLTKGDKLINVVIAAEQPGE